MAGTLTQTEENRLELILTIQSLYNDGESIHEIAHITGKDWKTVKKYLDGDPKLLCKSRKRSPLDIYTGFIINSSNFPQGFLMKSLINSDYVSSIMLTYTGLDKTYDLAHYTKRAPAFGIIRSTKIHSYTERSARSYDNPKCKK